MAAIAARRHDAVVKYHRGNYFFSYEKVLFLFCPPSQIFLRLCLRFLVLFLFKWIILFVPSLHYVILFHKCSCFLSLLVILSFFDLPTL